MRKSSLYTIIVVLLISFGTSSILGCSLIGEVDCELEQSLEEDSLEKSNTGLSLEKHLSGCSADFYPGIVFFSNYNQSFSKNPSFSLNSIGKYLLHCSLKLCS